jgi:hypothetical protein
VDPLLQALDATSPWAADTSPASAALALLLAFVLGQALAWTYAWTHSGLSYSRSFTQSLVLMSVVVALVMFVIGNSLITAFGLLGALALVRFRNVLKDTRDTVFVFMALVVGMAVGTQRFGLALVGTASLVLVAAYLRVTVFGGIGWFDGYLTVRLAAGGRAKDESGQLLRRFCRDVRPVSARHGGDTGGQETVYHVGLRDRDRGIELVERLRGVDGVEDASLVLRDELSEM